ncbi:MAG: divalent-cation tolerance protein CutA [Acidobacteriia bacterium]|nr:divalent-cation tolerance protein CutA [Terriglobia bacterium]
MASEGHGFAIVLTTAGTDEEASRIAAGLVERRVAACVNVVPGVVSHYRWKGEVHRDDERLLLIKTAERLLPEVGRAIRELHSYELPEVVMVRIGGGDEEYLAWLAEGLAPETGDGPPVGG